MADNAARLYERRCLLWRVLQSIRDPEQRQHGVYIFGDEVATRFADALAEAPRAGVT
jgi:hypothetical protein